MTGLILRGLPGASERASLFTGLIIREIEIPKRFESLIKFLVGSWTFTTEDPDTFESRKASL